MQEKLVLAYSGGLDTSVAIPWLKEKGYDVTAVVLDVGQHGKDLDFIKEKALLVGAEKSILLDTKAEFAQDYVVPVIQGNLQYEGEYPLVSALSRPLIIKKLVEIAHEIGATTIAHGSTGHGNDQVRFEAAIHAFDPELKIEAPIRDFQWSREEEIAYAEAHNVPIPVGEESPYSIDENIWGRAIEAGVLENPWHEAPEEAYTLTQSIETAPDEPEFMTLTFEAGVPVAVDGEMMPLPAIINHVNDIAGKHGIGRIDHIENRLVGIKSREIYEAPAAKVMMTAHKDLEDLTLEKDVAHFKPFVEQQLANLVYDAKWVSPLFDALQSFVKQTQQVVNGDVKMKLFKGNAIAVARQSATNSLYDEDLATYTASSSFDQASAVGFIELWTLGNTVFEQVNHVHSETGMSNG